jgi:hypothetical protein
MVRIQREDQPVHSGAGLKFSNGTMTLYSISKVKSPPVYILKHITGPCREDLKNVSVADESSLIVALITLGVPDTERATVLRELRINSRSIVKFVAHSFLFGE